MAGSIGLPSRALVNQADASMIERADVPRSKFTGSWTRLMTFDAQRLYPFMVDEVLPGDHMSYNVTAYVRLSTPLFPVFSNMRIDTHFFFVPWRLVWTHWVNFMGEQLTPSSSINYTVPTTTQATAGAASGSLWDHFGLPLGSALTGPLLVSALPFRAYNRIYNDWFRDENLVNGPTLDVGDGPDVTAYGLFNRAKFHDYFASALPWPQKFVAPTVPLGASAPVRGFGFSGAVGFGAVGGVVNLDDASVAFTGSPWVRTFVNDVFGTVGGVYADLSAAAGISINTLRQAFLVQQLLERDARGGSRYTETVLSHFGVRSPDARLQRTEYVGGGQSPLNITPIAQTAPSAGVTVGALGAAGTAAGSHHANVAATEHGCVIGLISVRAEQGYQEGLPRMWSRQSRYDFYWPSLAGLGEQAILRKEIYARGSVNDDLVFGYQERWQEYRTRYSEVTGTFRSGIAGTLDAWHLVQYFGATPPTLGQTFIESPPPLARVLAAGSLAVDQQFLADILISRSAVRPIPTYGTPALLGRF